MFDFFRGDKRKHYRVPLGIDTILSAEVTVGVDTVVNARVVNTSVGGAALTLSENDGRLLSIGRPAAIVFHSQRSPRVITVRALVMRISRSENGPPIHGFKFIEQEPLLKQLDQSWWTYFNRRKSYRVQLQYETGFQVNLVSAEAVYRAAPLHNLSPDGLGVELPLEAVESLAVTTQFRTAFRLPQLERAMSLNADVVHVTALGDLALVGLRFRSDGTHDYDELHRGMVEYTLRLQARTP